MAFSTEYPFRLEDAFAQSRSRLVRWMTALTHDPQAAEDIVQDTLLIAWQKHADLTDPAGVDAWLNAIAHNVYKRWARAHGKTAKLLIDLDETTIPAADTTEYDLERDELIDMLDAAIDMLPAQTREILIARYMEGLPQAKVAQLLGMTESAVAVRVHRGKLTLREIMDTESDDGWKSTRIWCPVCGKSHYESQFNPETGDFFLRCPGCDDRHPELQSWGHREHPAIPISKGLKTIKPALNRVMKWMHQDLNPVLPTGWYRCYHCDLPIKIELGMPPEMPAKHVDLPGVHYRCHKCGNVGYSALNGIALITPQGTRFWKDHERIQYVGMKALNEYEGRAAIVVSNVSLKQPEQRFEVIFAQDTHEILSINGEPYSASENE